MKAEIFEIENLIESAHILKFRNEIQDIVVVFDDTLDAIKIVTEGLKQEIDSNRGQDSFRVDENLVITATTEFSNVETLLKQHNFRLFLIIDIHHGAVKERYGLEVIREIRSSIYPPPFIVAYSSDTSNSSKQDAKDAGADLFVRKTSKDWDTSKREIMKAIFEHFVLGITEKIYPLTPTEQYHCRVLEIEDTRVLLHLEDSQDRNLKTRRYFAINRFKKVGIENLSEGFPLLLSIYETIDEDGTGITKVIFEKGDDTFFPTEETDWDFFENFETQPL
jgi:CheY-like chemotaxis protein